MPRGRRTSYTRDNRGRFASSPNGGAPKRSTPATRRAATRAGNRLNRDNSGRITGIGRDGATVRGGRIRTAKGNRRATQIASMRPAGFRSGTIAKGGRGVRGSVARSLAAVRAAGGRKAVGLSRARPGQQQRAMQRAQANEKRLQGPAMKGTGLRTRAGVGYAVAKGAQGYYSGSMPRRKATFSPLTGSMDKKALAARRKQVVDNNKPQKGKAAAGLSRARPGQEQRAMQRVGGAGTVLQRRDNAEAQRVAASGGRRTSRKEAINRRMYNSITTAIRARYAIDNPGKQRRYSTVKNPGPAGVSALTTKAPRLTAKASQPSPQTRAKRPASTVRKPSGLKPGALAARQQPQKPSKKPVNKAQRAYLDARSNARDRNRDLRGADAGSRRMANSAAAVLRNMERRRSTAVPKAPADSPRAKQQQRQAARVQRANSNSRAAWAREADGPNSKASRSATVARRAQQIYAGKVDPKAKTKSRLTKTRDPEVLRKRIAKIKDNTARAAAKGVAKAAKASAKPAKPARARRSKPDLSQGSFERRARATEKRAKAAERVVSTVDRFNPANRRLVNRANSLRSAADSYAYYARRGKNDPDFSAADLFKGRSRGSTAPRLTRSEKAAATRRAKADKRFRENVRRMEQDRRR